MTDTPTGGAGRWARLAQLVRDHPLLAVASALGSIGTFAAGTAAFAGLFMDDGGAVARGPGLVDRAPYEYVEVADRTGQISLEVPDVWARFEGDGWHPGDLPPIVPGTRVGPGLNATTNLQTWHLDLRTPGVFVGASRIVPRHYTNRELLGNFAFGNCETTASGTYESDALTGETVTLTCPGATWRLVAATPRDFPDFVVYFQTKLVSTADEGAYDHMLETLEVDLRA